MGGSNRYRPSLVYITHERCLVLYNPLLHNNNRYAVKRAWQHMLVFFNKNHLESPFGVIYCYAKSCILLSKCSSTISKEHKHAG